MPSIVRTTVKKVTADHVTDADDLLASEEPLEIMLEYGTAGKRTRKSISVTMRTPGNDSELAAGFLYTEGIIAGPQDIRSIEYTRPENDNIVCVSLAESAVPDTSKLERHFYTTSSCGVCGKASIEAVRIACHVPDVPDDLRFTAAMIYQLPDR